MSQEDTATEDPTEQMVGEEDRSIRGANGQYAIGHTLIIEALERDLNEANRNYRNLRIIHDALVDDNNARGARIAQLEGECEAKQNQINQMAARALAGTEKKSSALSVVPDPKPVKAVAKKATPTRRTGAPTKTANKGKVKWTSVAPS